MRKKVIAWAIGSTLFAGIVGFWAYQLPDAIKRSTAGQDDQGLRNIISTFNGDGSGMSSDLKQIQADFDKNLSNIQNSVKAGEVQGQAITDLKTKILEHAPANAGQNTNTNVNVNANIPNAR